jgi:hypothetical protein
MALNQSNPYISSVTLHPTELLTRRLGKDFTGCTIPLERTHTLIIGPNGTGKSTLFRAVRAATSGDGGTKGSWNREFRDTNSVDVEWSEPADKPGIVFMDGVTDNRAHQGFFDYDNMGMQLQAMNSSHGIGVVIQTGESIVRGCDNDLPIWLDEADTSFDIDAVFAAMYRLVMHTNQVVVVSHNLMVLKTAIDFGWNILETRTGYVSEILSSLSTDTIVPGTVTSLPWAVPYENPYHAYRVR